MGRSKSTPSGRLELRITATRGVIGFERAARRFWPLVTLGMVVFVLRSFGLVALAPVGTQGFVWAGLGILGALAFIWGSWGYRWPSRADAVTRLDADLAGRPVAALADDMATGKGDPAAEALWIAHQARMSAAADAARPPLPELKLAARDPFALRLAAVTGVVAALLFAREPLLETVQPVVSAEAAVAAGPAFEGWAVPPGYTGLPTLYLPDLVDAPAIELPWGSVVTLRVYGDAPAQLEQTVTPLDTPLVERAEGIRDVSLTAEVTGTLELQLGSDETVWPITVSADAPPMIAPLGPPSGRINGDMELTFEASDDYAVQSATVSLTLDLAAVDRRHGLTLDPAPRAPTVIELPMPLTGDRQSFVETLTDTVAEHPFAGLPVVLTLRATDGAGQVGEAPPLSASLPARRFFDPLAAAIVEQRRDLLWTPDNAERVSRLLRALTHAPEDYELPAGAYLAVRSVITRLDLARETGTVAAETDALAADLWAVAVLIDNGAMADAEERLRRAQDALADALENGASDEEIAELMDELRDAMEQFMEQAAREALERGQDDQQAQNQPQGEMSGQDLQDLLDQIQELSEAGERDAAQALLDQLRQMMENMEFAMREGGQPGQEGQQGVQENLQDMLREQQDLADEAFREMQRQFAEGMQRGEDQQGPRGNQPQEGSPQAQRPQQPGNQPQQGQQPGQQPGGVDQPQSFGDGLGSLAERQEALRQMLDDMRNALPGADTEAGEQGRQALDEAEENMGAARDALDREDGQQALNEQAEAMENMRQAMRDLGQEALEQARDQAERDGGQGQAQADPQGRRDPLGRPSGANGEMDGRDTRVPDADQIGRSRELSEELRRRAGERDRPDAERDYLERLLDRF